MRRLLTATLVAGLLAAGSTTFAGGVASAATTVIHQTTCTPAGNDYFSSSSNGVSYYLGTPNKVSAGSAAILKPKQNSTTLWTLSACPQGDLLENGGLALTSGSSSPGAA